MGTGGGPPPKPLTDFDMEVVEMLSPIQKEGLSVDGIHETAIQFVPDEFYGSNNVSILFQTFSAPVGIRKKP